MGGDTRVFFKMDVGYFRNPKIMLLLEECRDAVFLHMAAIAYARQHLTDGVVPTRAVMRDVLLDPCGPHCGSHCDPQCARMMLRINGLLEPVDDRRDRVHDYGKHNQTSSEVGARKAAAQEAANARWHPKGNARRNANRIADGTAPGTADRNAEWNAEKRREEKNYARAREARFEEFWNAYPRKVGKGQAEKAWKTAVKDTDPDDILAGLRSQLPKLTQSETKFIPHPTTWLNGDRWEDQLTDTHGATGVGRAEAFAGIPRVNELRFHDEDES